MFPQHDIVLVREKLKDCLFLHASASIFPFGAVLFLGYSGSGKSTITEILKPEYSKLADDAVFLKQIGIEWCVSNADYKNYENPNLAKIASMSRRMGNESIPLAGAFKLHKGKSLGCLQVSALEMCKYLTDAAFEVDVQRKITTTNNRKYLFSQAALIARKIEGWDLHFDREVDINSLSNLLSRCFFRRKTAGG